MEQSKKHKPRFGALEILRYIGPGLLVTVGFIDPGNWASNLAAGADFGYTLLWVVSLSTIMLIILQHNVAHLGIVTGYCLSEAAMHYIRPLYAKPMLYSAMAASVSTSLAEILGGAIALQMLFNVPLRVGAVIITAIVIMLLFSNTYRKIERWIIAFVSIIGISFIYELSLVDISWSTALYSAVRPSFPDGSIIIIMSVLGAVVMPHNLFLHSEVIQSRQWNLEKPEIIRRQLRYEFWDTMFSMLIGWAINSAMILLAASTFFAQAEKVSEMSEAQQLLVPLLGENAAVIFAVALLMAGISSTLTSGMAAGSIFAGIYKESYDIRDSHSKWGVAISFLVALIIIMLIVDPFKGLIYSQMILSIQLPITIFLQVYLTSSTRVMGEYRNTYLTRTVLLALGILVSGLNLMLLFKM